MRKIKYNTNITSNGCLLPSGEALFNKYLTQDEKNRVNQAINSRLNNTLITRGGSANDQSTELVDLFLAALEPYGDGVSFEECGEQAALFFTPEGGLRLRANGCLSLWLRTFRLMS